MRRVAALSVLLLVVATGIATIAAPTAADATSPATGPSDQTDVSTATAVGNGTVIVKYRMAGTTATGMSVDDPRTARKRVAAELGVPADRVAIVGQSGSTSVEVRSPDVTPAELATALSANVSVDRENVSTGVDDSGCTAARQWRHARLGSMDEYEGAVVRVEDRQLYVRVSPEPPQTVLDRLGQRGEVTVAAQTPDGDTVELLDNADFVATQPVTKHDGFASFPAKLSEPAASCFASELVGLNFTADGINACTGNPAPDGQGYCLVVSLDGERVSTAGITRELARALEDGRFAEQQWMRVAVANVTTAHDARLAVLSQPILT